MTADYKTVCTSLPLVIKRLNLLMVEACFRRYVHFTNVVRAYIPANTRSNGCLMNTLFETAYSIQQRSLSSTLLCLQLQT
jgi:hypothetical protein